MTEPDEVEGGNVVGPASKHWSQGYASLLEYSFRSRLYVDLCTVYKFAKWLLLFYMWSNFTGMHEHLQVIARWCWQQLLFF